MISVRCSYYVQHIPVPTRGVLTSLPCEPDRFVGDDDPQRQYRKGDQSIAFLRNEVCFVVKYTKRFVTIGKELVTISF
jgi:hypothetical protein